MSDLIPPKVLAVRLEPWERLIWWDRPRQGLRLRLIDAVLIPCSLLLLVMAIRRIASAFNSSHSQGWPGALFGLVAVLVCFYFIIGRFIHDASRRSGIYYALTNERVLIATAWACRALPLNSLDEITIEEAGDGEGTLLFGAPLLWGVGNNHGQLWTGAPDRPAFELIGEVRRVLVAIVEARERAEQSAFRSPWA